MKFNKYIATLGIIASITTLGMTGCSKDSKNTSSDNTQTEQKVEATFTDGTYTAKADQEENGYTSQVSISVENGKITAVDWDAVDADGRTKKEKANAGEYVMTEDGPNWTEQSEALAKYVVEHQSLDGLTMNEDGKTDVVASVSISINSFVELVQKCMDEAAAK